MNRCEWCLINQENMDYHDNEWGVQQHDDRLLFEHLVLEGAQAGLSWNTILLRRQNYERAFDNYDIKKISEYDEKKFDELLQDSGIIRNKLKIRSVINNAKIVLKIQREYGSFNEYLWQFMKNIPIKNDFKTLKELPAQTELSKNISKDMKKRGFSFTGPTGMYAFMQSTGMVNDHITTCFRYEQV